MKLFTIPNLFTLGNLLCGCLAIVFAFNGDLVWSAYLVGIAAVLDFLDGFVARALNQHSPIGKDLDSLADMVTFGVVPGIVMFQLLRSAFDRSADFGTWGANHLNQFNYPWAFVAFIIPLFSALRLAKFNNDTRQSDSFIGVPTPANAILICSIPLILHDLLLKTDTLSLAGERADLSAVESLAQSMFGNPYVLISLTAVMSFLLIAEFPLFALKFKSFGWKGNEIRWIFLALCAVMLIVLKLIALPLIIVIYVLLSVMNNLIKRKPKSTP